MFELCQRKKQSSIFCLENKITIDEYFDGWRFDSLLKIHKFFHEISNMLQLTQTHKWEDCKTLHYFLHHFPFYSSLSNHPILLTFPKKKSRFQFLRQQTPIHFWSTFQKKKKKIIISTSKDDRGSSLPIGINKLDVSNLSSRAAINIIFNKATTSTRIRFICDKISRQARPIGI